jgi:glycosyltransferase involved in cell wall biosynthesis
VRVVQSRDTPAILVLSSLFPSARQPLAGVFIKERMKRVARYLPVTVVSPQPWFPLQGLLRLGWPNYRPPRPRHEIFEGFEVLRPRFFALPGALRRLDGFMMAVGAWRTVRRLKQAGRADVIDAHFAYPDGYAATRLGHWLGIPVTVTLRGSEPRQAQDSALRARLRRALSSATRVFSVSESLRQVALSLGTPSERTRVISNGVDLHLFKAIDRNEARRRLGLPPEARVLISVGGLVERKGFHRVIELLPELRQRFPELHYVIVGAASPEGDWTNRLKSQVERAGLGAYVHFLGAVLPADLHVPLSAADVFVLATRNEGWANVFLEAMACGLPVVTTRVGGNAEVVCRDDVGIIVPFGDSRAMCEALAAALERDWDRSAIRRYADANSWERKIETLVAEFRSLVARQPSAMPRPKATT